MAVTDFASKLWESCTGGSNKDMKKSRTVKIGILSGIAASCVAFGGCSKPSQPVESWDQVCVDGKNTVALAQKCEEEDKAKRTNSAYIPMYHWYYMHSRAGSSAHYPIGSIISGGTFTRPSSFSATGSSSSHNAGVARGGFGTTGAGHTMSS